MSVYTHQSLYFQFFIAFSQIYITNSLITLNLIIQTNKIIISKSINNNTDDTSTDSISASDASAITNIIKYNDNHNLMKVVNIHFILIMLFN